MGIYFSEVRAVNYSIIIIVQSQCYGTQLLEGNYRNNRLEASAENRAQL